MKMLEFDAITGKVDIDIGLLKARNSFIENSQHCYLPFGVFFLKPFSRIISYTRILKQLSSTLPVAHPDHASAKACYNLSNQFWSEIEPQFITLSNKHLSNQVRQEIEGVNYDAAADEKSSSNNTSIELLRKGSLNKLTEKGYEQRLFMILGNSLIWTGKGINTRTKRFVAHGEVKLEQGVELETSEEQPLAFRVGNLILSCTTQEERDKWLTDIANLVQENVEGGQVSLLKRNGITDEDEDTDPSLASQTPGVNEANSVHLVGN